MKIPERCFKCANMSYNSSVRCRAYDFPAIPKPGEKCLFSRPRLASMAKIPCQNCRMKRSERPGACGSTYKNSCLAWEDYKEELARIKCEEERRLPTEKFYSEDNK